MYVITLQAVRVRADQRVGAVHNAVYENIYTKKNRATLDTLLSHVGYQIS